MATVTIFGTGNMGTAIGDVVTAGGATVQHVRSADDATIAGDIVVLAVPYSSLAPIAAKYASQFEGKIVVDITNPVDQGTFDSLVVPAGSSAAAELAEALPAAKVLKAFNTNFAGSLAAKKVGTIDTTVLIAGDDAEAKNTLSALVSAGGVNAIDAGSLKRAHELEALGFLQILLAAGEKISWAGGFGVIN